jgi:hypothetical protein
MNSDELNAFLPGILNNAIEAGETVMGVYNISFYDIL